MKGKLPFPKWILKTPVKVYQTYTSEDGEPVEELIFDGLCCYEEKMKQKLDKERRLVTLSGKVIIQGDINPGKLIEGLVRFGEIERPIFSTSRPQHPDGSVFSTELELM
ncbi:MULTISPECIES: hypothetical protein [unclassified Paenibacillus]|uniref:hypothetical protein n=1 Tax=unclassified Paenibacillus TaxID=185978 RepID=UPI0024052E19|nr:MULTISPECIES: hypothetical protein [unclassified Paenibacillus]MDF9845177.1 hypothetical protein [Paenibacillus sp. PastF-2]MDF9850331.1 hypothetical protein [Paenibacillus sp. PastM-2]MDF9856966.1 hypothetical protein [Paenibacillus sp. PastF-1]MDH6482177.1 hypothetical protein [Paenibacillus sp. PastH-2]MDH6509659.1 hypothetical protein [Paenibacillus sp. PastM-3]